MIISHGDADGIISACVALKKLGLREPLFFSTSTSLKKLLCRTIAKLERLPNLYIFDISPSPITLKLASIFPKTVWIDHHIPNPLEAPENVELVLDAEAESAAKLVAKYFGVELELVEIANQIDTNSVVDDDAHFLRELVSAVKWKYRGRELGRKLRSMTKVLATKGLEYFEKKDSILTLLKEYEQWKEKMLEEIMQKLRVEEVGEKKVAILETHQGLPVYILTEKLKDHESKPFDIIALLIHGLRENRIFTRIELRTHTQENVFRIASSLGGGGHKFASGVSIKGFMGANDFLEHLRNMF